jgi:hypothetical protein
MVMAILVQPRAELEVCCRNELTNGLNFFAQLQTAVRLQLVRHQNKYNNSLMRIIRTRWQNALNRHYYRFNAS